MWLNSEPHNFQTETNKILNFSFIWRVVQTARSFNIVLYRYTFHNNLVERQSILVSNLLSFANCIRAYTRIRKKQSVAENKISKIIINLVYHYAQIWTEQFPITRHSLFISSIHFLILRWQNVNENPQTSTIIINFDTHFMLLGLNRCIICRYRLYLRFLYTNLVVTSNFDSYTKKKRIRGYYSFIMFKARLHLQFNRFVNIYNFHYSFFWGFHHHQLYSS